MKSEGQTKLLGLEAFRFLCAFSVLLYHYQHFAFIEAHPVNFNAQEQPLYGILSFLYDNGFYGVQLFWCISGFIFSWKYAAAISGRKTGGYKFFIYRISRLYPLHIATLLVVAILQYIYLARNGFFYVSQVNDVYHFILQLFLASNWIEQEGSFNSPIWSISVEIVAYFLFFLVARYVSVSVWISAVVILICIGAKALHVDLKIIDCVMYFYAGGLAGLFSKYPTSPVQLRNKKLFAALFCVAASAIFVDYHLYNLRYSQGLYILIVAPVFLYSIADVEFRSRAANGMVQFLGNLTYAMYLLHFPLQLAAALIFSYLAIEMPWRSGWMLAIYLFVTMGGAAVVFTRFEAPVQAFIRRISGVNTAVRAG